MSFGQFGDSIQEGYGLSFMLYHIGYHPLLRRVKLKRLGYHWTILYQSSKFNDIYFDHSKNLQYILKKFLTSYFVALYVKIYPAIFVFHAKFNLLSAVGHTPHGPPFFLYPAKQYTLFSKT